METTGPAEIFWVFVKIRFWLSFFFRKKLLCCSTDQEMCWWISDHAIKVNHWQHSLTLLRTFRLCFCFALFLRVYLEPLSITILGSFFGSFRKMVNEFSWSTTPSFRFLGIGQTFAVTLHKPVENVSTSGKMEWFFQLAYLLVWNWVPRDIWRPEYLNLSIIF